MASKYRIEIDGDAGGIKSAAQQAADALRKVGSAATAGMTEQEKAAKKAADAQIKEAQKAEREAKKVTDAQAKEAKKAAEQVEREAKKAADAQIKEAKRAFDASFVGFAQLESAAKDLTGKLAVEAAKRRAKDEQEEAKKNRTLLSAEDANLRVRNALIDQANKKRIESGLKAFDAEEKGFSISKLAAKSFADMVGSVAGQFTLLNLGQTVLSSITDGFLAARRSAEEAGNFVTSYREDLLELAALKGQLGNTTPETRNQLEFRAKTLQDRDQAKQFQEAMLGAGASAIGNNINQAEFDKLMVSSGAAQAALGTDAASMGTLSGMLPLLMGGKDIQAEQAINKRQQLFSLLDFGASTPQVGSQMLMKNAPLVTSGLFRDVADMATLQSAFSLSSKEGAGETVQQFTRATVGGLGRMRGNGYEGGEKQAEYLKRLGATDQMDPIQIGKLVSKDFSKREVEEKAKGREFNAMNYLQQHGFGNQEDIKALSNFHGLVKSGTYAKYEARAVDQKPILEAEGKIREFGAVDPVGMKRKADLSIDLAKTTVGVGPMEFYNSMRKMAFARLKASGEIEGEFDDWKDSTLPSVGSGLGGGRQRLHDEAVRMMETGFKNKGMAIEDVSPRSYFNYALNETDQTRASRLYEANTRLQAAGGDATSATMNEIRDLMKRSVELAERSEGEARRSLPPAPLNGAPKGPNPRP